MRKTQVLSVYTISSATFVTRLASWCFEPSQPHRIISRLKTHFKQSPTLGKGDNFVEGKTLGLSAHHVKCYISNVGEGR